MKISKYSFQFVANNNKYVYNSLTNALLEIDEQTYDILTDNINKTACNFYKLDREAYDVFLQNGIITENDTDDFLKYKSAIYSQRKYAEFMHLTITPTMDCCFRCYYCFEKHTDSSYISNETIDNIVAYINRQHDVKRIKITWFGGEPLMAQDKIELFYKKFHNIANRFTSVNSNIITTGYHINPKTIQLLKSIGISSMQITLDGKKETHNRIKHLNGEDVFSKVWDNISLMKELAPEIEVVIRVNLTKDNSDEFIELLQKFHTDFKNIKNIAIAPAFVMNRNNAEECCGSKLFSHAEKSEFTLKLASNGINSPFLNYPEHFFNECAIRNNVAISFDPEGFAYKCWEVIGNKEYAIGRLNENGEITDINEKNLNRQLFGAEAIEDPVCSHCKYLPICNGGCPIQRIQNKFEGANNNTCTYLKGYLPDFFKYHILHRKLNI